MVERVSSEISHTKPIHFSSLWKHDSESFKSGMFKHRKFPPNIYWLLLAAAPASSSDLLMFTTAVGQCGLSLRGRTGVGFPLLCGVTASRSQFHTARRNNLPFLIKTANRFAHLLSNRIRGPLATGRRRWNPTRMKVISPSEPVQLDSWRKL